VADLLLELAGSTHVVARSRLIVEWKRMAADIKATPSAARYADSGKGALATKLLKDSLVKLERTPTKLYPSEG
jgi:hypothetical protein